MGLTASSPYIQSASKLNLAFIGRAGATSLKGKLWDTSRLSPLILTPSEVLSYFLKGSILQWDICQATGL